MSNYRHLIVVDLSSYGSALALINELCDDEGVKVFEVSPMGSGALLIMMTKEITAAAIVKSQIQSQMNPSVLNICLIENAHDELLKTYLSQTQVKVEKNIIVIECAFVSEAIVVANQLLSDSVNLLDLRVVRTFPSNTIITATATQAEKLLESVKGKANTKYNLIVNPQLVLKSYFEI